MLFFPRKGNLWGLGFHREMWPWKGTFFLIGKRNSQPFSFSNSITFFLMFISGNLAYTFPYVAAQAGVAALSGPSKGQSLNKNGSFLRRRICFVNYKLFGTRAISNDDASSSVIWNNVPFLSFQNRSMKQYERKINLRNQYCSMYL